MAPVTSLLPPTLVSAGIVFVASSIIRMDFHYHHDDWKRLPSHHDVQQAMRRFSVPPGDYHERGDQAPNFVITIWYNRKWRTTLVSMFDGLIYGLLTAGTFGWLWPK